MKLKTGPIKDRARPNKDKSGPIEVKAGRMKLKERLIEVWVGSKVFKVPF